MRYPGASVSIVKYRGVPAVLFPTADHRHKQDLHTTKKAVDIFKPRGSRPLVNYCSRLTFLLRAHPPPSPLSLQMVFDAIKTLKERNGSSIQAIKKSITATYPSLNFTPHQMRSALKKGVESGKFIKVRNEHNVTLCALALWVYSCQNFSAFVYRRMRTYSVFV